MYDKSNILESTALDDDEKTVYNDKNMLSVETFMPPCMIPNYKSFFH